MLPIAGATARATALAFVTAFVTLFAQVLVHRMVSLKLLNNYAFLVIALTMLGFAVSGIVLSVALSRWLARRADAIATWAALFTLTLLGVSAVFYHAPTSLYLAQSRAEFVVAFFGAMPLALLYAVPFGFCGLILGVLLSAPELSTRRIYGFDLLGSATGALVVLPAITALGVEVSAILACALLWGAAVALMPPRGRLAWALVVVAALATALAAGGRETVFRMRYPDGSMLAATRNPASGWVIEHGEWDPIAHVELTRFPPPEAGRPINFPAFVGENPAFWRRVGRVITQNNWAFTLAPHYDGQPTSLTGLEQTIYAAAYHATSVRYPRVLVIGVGGGPDVLAALRFDASSVTAAEVNAATVRILTRVARDYFRHWVEDPRVRLLNAEGRSLLSMTPGPFDVITVSGVDTYSGTPAAVHVFSENYLYTDEAFDLYLRRLGPDGVLSMQRVEHGPPREMLRALTSAVAALRRAGVERPENHIMMVTVADGSFASMQVKKTPFTEAERGRFEAWAAGSRLFRLSAAPARNGEQANAYQVFLTLGTADRETAFVGFYPFDISPVRDDRPFFFHFSFWWHLASRQPAVWASVPAMEYSVVLLLVLVGVTAVACIALPLWWAAGAPPPGAGRFALFFAGAGVGYLLIEIALLQKFGLFLGHPNYALSVVLAALLAGTGLGSLSAERVVAALGHLRFVGYLLAGIVLVEYALVLPQLSGLQALTLWLKALIVVALVLPVGWCLGTFLPVGLERLKVTHPAFVPWAWGVNGIFSVLAPIVGIAISMTWGITALLLAAIPLYLVVASVLPGDRGGPEMAP